MQKERWMDIVGRVKDKFEIEEHQSFHEDQEGGADIEYVVFSGPMGRVKLQYKEKPVVMDKKTIYSNRIGSETKVEYVYSDTERSSRMQAFVWDDSEGDWREIDAASFS